MTLKEQTIVIEIENFKDEVKKIQDIDYFEKVKINSKLTDLYLLYLKSHNLDYNSILVNDKTVKIGLNEIRRIILKVDKVSNEYIDIRIDLVEEVKESILSFLDTLIQDLKLPV